MTLDFAIACSLVRPGRPRYPVLVYRTAALLHASFRPRLTATPLRFANPTPSSGWIEDFHLQAVASRLLPSHTTVHTGPYTAVHWIERWRSFTPTPAALMMGPVAPASVPSSNAVRASPIPVVPKARCLEFRPHGRSEVSMFERPANVRAFGEARSTYYALC
jgi:hypothetical protein